MGKPFYVRYDQPEGLEEEGLKILSRLSEIPGAVKKGTNETTKAIERGKAKLVFIALDVEPPEIVGHLPLLAEEKKIPYMYVSTKEKLGEACKIKVKAASCAIVDSGPYTKDIETLAARIRELAGF